MQRIDFDSLNTRCVALISAMDADGQCNYYDDVPLLLTRKIQAKYYQWPAPRAQTAMSMKCGAPAACSATSQAWRSEADVIFVGIGPLGTKAPSLKTALSIRRRWMS
jgi:DNA-binding transcriptional regulator LsrR (DeoR family)